MNELNDRVASKFSISPHSRPNLVKICGNQTVADAEAAATLGADLIGFIFAPARRRIESSLARDAIRAAKAAARGRDLIAVGVFVDASPEEMNEIADHANLDLLQLHGNEPAAWLPLLNRPVIKALRPAMGSRVEAVTAVIERYQTSLNVPVAYLIDGYAPHVAGGAGVRADWPLSAALARTWPIILAGGLQPDIVGAAIDQVRPVAVDVSSGVETEGAKDWSKIEAFIGQAKVSFQRSP